MQNVDILKERFKNMNLTNEVKIARQIGNITVFGRIDILVNGRDIYELKCKYEFSHDDVLQTAIYLALTSKEVGYLFYVPINTLYEIRLPIESSIKFLEILIDGKKDPPEISDEIFIRNANDVKSNLSKFDGVIPIESLLNDDVADFNDRNDDIDKFVSNDDCFL